MAEIIRIDRNTWRIEDGHVRFYLFCGTERAVLIDTGMNQPEAGRIAESLTDLPLVLVNTHADRDHISGNSAFEEFYMSPAEEENYRAHGGKGRLIPVREGDVIDPGGRPLRVIDIPGHTPGSIALLDEKNRVLVSGDSVQDGRIFMFGSHRNLPRYIESLKHLAEYDGLYDEIYPMHGSFPVEPGLVGKLLTAAQEILDGQAVSTPADLAGNTVSYYQFPFAGFLCDPPAENGTSERRKEMKTVYDFTVKDRQGNDVSLSEYRGKVLLIVNTATGCGFTPHYDPLEAMYKEFKGRGFEILDFPCNQFANQAPGSDDEIHEFCTLKFGTEFPQFRKIDVNGETADPLYAFLATEKPFEGFGKGLKNAALKKFSDMNNKVFGDKAYIKWNFTKFLVDREGKVIARFEPTADMQEVRNAVEAAL